MNTSATPSGARRTVRGLFLLTMSLGLVLLGDGSEDASASIGIKYLPVRWCLVEGSPTETNPGDVGAQYGEPGATSDDVLWRRHERVSDGIYIPLAGISFRSAVTPESIGGFPVIPDPEPGPTMNTPPGSLNVNSPTELTAMINACDEAWSKRLTGNPHHGLPGVTVINVSVLVNGSGVFATRGFGTPDIKCGENVADHAAFTPAGGVAVVQDRWWFFSNDEDAHTLGHELGHVLGLWHTDPMVLPGNLMTGAGLDLESGNVQDMTDWSTSDCLTGNVPRTVKQIDWIQIEADEWPSNAVDPLGVLFPGPFQSTLEVDPLDDVPPGEQFVDISEFQFSEDSNTGRSRLTWELLDLAAAGPDLHYWTLVDQDNDPVTGGDPSRFPPGVPQTSFRGVEVIGHLLLDGGTLIGTLWSFDPVTMQFVEIAQTQGVSWFFEARRRGLILSDPSLDLARNRISLEFNTSLTGPTSSRFRIQAFAHDPNMGVVDRLDDTDAGVVLSLVPPSFPECLVTPGTAAPGDAVIVTAAGLVPNTMLHAAFGDQAIGNGATDGDGEAMIPFTVPSGATPGLRLVTVGVDGTALTADCTMEVLSPRRAVICNGQAAGEPGTRVSVPITLSEGGDVAGFQVDVSYNASILSLTDMSLGSETAAAGGWTVAFASIGPGTIRVLGHSDPPTGLGPGPSEVAVAEFEIATGAPTGPSPLSQENCVLSDDQGLPIPCEVCPNPGAVVVRPAASFRFRSIPSPVGVDLFDPLPFPVTVEAVDALGTLATAYGGVASMTIPAGACAGALQPSSQWFAGGVGGPADYGVPCCLDPLLPATSTPLQIQASDTPLAITGVSGVFTGVAKGDLDGSGAVSVLDVTRAARLALGLSVAAPPPSDFQRWAGNMLDANCMPDASINVLDVVRLRNKVLGRPSLCPCPPAAPVVGGTTPGEPALPAASATAVRIRVEREGPRSYVVVAEDAADLGGLQLELRSPGPQAVVFPAGLLEGRDWQVLSEEGQGGTLRVIAFANSAAGISGDGPVLRIAVPGRPKLISAVASDSHGREVPVR